MGGAFWASQGQLSLDTAGVWLFWGGGWPGPARLGRGPVSPLLYTARRGRGGGDHPSPPWSESCSVSPAEGPAPASVSGLLLNFTASWGDSHYLGLTGLEVVGKGGKALPLALDQILASPRDLNDLAEYTEDSRTLDK